MKLKNCRHVLLPQNLKQKTTHLFLIKYENGLHRMYFQGCIMIEKIGIARAPIIRAASLFPCPEKIDIVNLQV